MLQFSHGSGDGYIDWMGKCEEYGPTCEWEARMYSTSTAEGRPNRISAYVFKPSAGLGSTGCMCQYGVVPAANDSPLDIGTMAKDAWFAGAIGKVALYDKLLSPAEITGHYKAMTGKDPTGSCQSTCKF